MKRKIRNNAAFRRRRRLAETVNMYAVWNIGQLNISRISKHSEIQAKQECQKNYRKIHCARQKNTGMRLRI